MAVIDNTLAAQVDTFNPATPLAQAAQIQQAQASAQQAQFKQKQEQLGAEVRGLQPYVNTPEFPTKWAETADRLLQQGVLDPETHQKWRNTPSPLLMKSIIAQTTSPELAFHQQQASPQNVYETEKAKQRAASEFAPKTVDVKRIGPYGDTQTETMTMGPDGKLAPIGGASSPGGSVPGSPAGVLPEDTGPALMDKLKVGNLAVANRVQQLVDGKGGMPNARTNPIDKVAMPLAQQYDPNWSMDKWNSRNTFRKDLESEKVGTTGGSIIAADTAFMHIDRALGNIDKLGNSDFSWWNKYANQARSAAGDVNFQKAEAKLAANLTGITTEVAKMLKGGQLAVEDVKAWRERMSTADSPEKLKAGLEEAMHMILDRLVPVAARYSQVMDTPKEPTDLLNPVSRKIAARVLGTGDKGTEPAKAAPADAGPAKPQSKADYDALPSGAQYIHRDGSLRTKP